MRFIIHHENIKTRSWSRFIPTILMIILLGQTLTSCSSNCSIQTTRLIRIKEKGVLQVGIRFDTPPHSFLNQNGELVGFDVDIANAVAKKLGVKLQITRVDELTRISFIQNGTIDLAVTSISHTKNRDKQIDFSETYFWSYQTFLVKKEKIKTLNDLVGKPVGMDRGSSAITNWNQWLVDNHFNEDSHIVEFSDKQVALDAVKQGVIAGWGEDYEVLSMYAKQDSSLTVLTGQQIGLKLDGIGLPSNDSELRDAINFALQEIATSGEYDKIYDQWFGPASDIPIPRKNNIEIWPDG